MSHVSATAQAGPARDVPAAACSGAPALAVSLYKRGGGGGGLFIYIHMYVIPGAADAAACQTCGPGNGVPRELLFRAQRLFFHGAPLHSVAFIFLVHRTMLAPSDSYAQMISLSTLCLPQTLTV